MLEVPAAKAFIRGAGSVRELAAAVQQVRDGVSAGRWRRAQRSCAAAVRMLRLAAACSALPFLVLVWCAPARRCAACSTRGLGWSTRPRGGPGWRRAGGCQRRPRMHEEGEATALSKDIQLAGGNGTSSSNSSSVIPVDIPPSVRTWYCNRISVSALHNNSWRAVLVVSSTGCHSVNGWWVSAALAVNDRIGREGWGHSAAGNGCKNAGAARGGQAGPAPHKNVGGAKKRGG